MKILNCEKMLFGGFGMTRTDQGVVFVEGLLPGETGEVKAAGKRGGIPFFTTQQELTTPPAANSLLEKILSVVITPPAD